MLGDYGNQRWRMAHHRVRSGHQSVSLRMADFLDLASGGHAVHMLPDVDGCCSVRPESTPLGDGS